MYLASRGYTALRLWVPAPVHRGRADRRVMGGLRAWVPTLLLGTVFGGGAFLILRRWRRDPSAFAALLPLASLTLYWWVIHIPFSIQARYMLPVHLPALALIAAVSLPSASESSEPEPGPSLSA